eukprot:jgi/Chlat1/9067/Chrsp94S08363
MGVPGLSCSAYLPCCASPDCLRRAHTAPRARRRQHHLPAAWKQHASTKLPLQWGWSVKLPEEATRNVCCCADTPSTSSQGGGQFKQSLAPLSLKTANGVRLFQVLQSNTFHDDFDTAVESELALLREYHAGPKVEEAIAAEPVLARRISDLKGSEVHQAHEEVLYALVVHQFLIREIPLLPRLQVPADGGVRRDLFGGGDSRAADLRAGIIALEELHSRGVFDIIRENHHTHRARFFRRRSEASFDKKALVSKKELAQIYKDSLLFGYYLKRADTHADFNALFPDAAVGATTVRQYLRTDLRRHAAEESLTTSDAAGETAMPTESRRVVSRQVEALFWTAHEEGETGSSDWVPSWCTTEVAQLLRASSQSNQHVNETLFIDDADMQRIECEGCLFGTLLWDVQKRLLLA